MGSIASALDGEIAAGGKLRYRPELDGLRAIAVSLVIAFHYTDTRLLGGGSLGVDLFFVLSGFLITRLLLEEHVVAGRIDVRAFYWRRAARLYPALMLVSLMVLFGALFFNLGGGVSAVTRGVLTSLLYVTNWARVFGHHSVLDHTWSLAVEEQFYLVWPVLVLVGLKWRGTRAVSVIAVGLLVVSVAETVVRSLLGVSAETLYSSTDTHGFSTLMVGCVAATVVPAARGSRHWTITASRLLALPAVAFLAVLVMTTTFASAFYYRGGLVLVSVACTSIIVWALHSESIAADLLRSDPMAYLGRISYGLYLWHYPMRFLVLSALPDLAHLAQSLVALDATLVAAAISFQFLERPARVFITRRYTARRQRLVMQGQR